jgi:hypothetical protein
VPALVEQQRERVDGSARDRGREQAVASGGSDAKGTAMLLLGAFVCVAAIALGIWAMLQT